MRRIIGMLSELRAAELARIRKVKPNLVSDARIAECREMFEVLDTQLNGVRHDASLAGIAEVMTSGDFTYAILEFTQRRMLPGYQEQTFAFEPLVFTDTLVNYLSHDRYQKRAGLSDLEYVGEKGQARPDYVVDATKRSWSVYRWTKQWDFSHEALVNDDLGYFDDQAQLMGRAARRTLEKFVSRMYTNATSIGRLTGFASAIYATTGRLTSTRISTARMAFMQRVNSRGERIQNGLTYIVHHTGLTDVVRQIRASQLVPELATNAANVVQSGWTAIEDPYITGTAPNLPWWAFANPAQIKTMVLARLAGRPGPILSRKRSDIEAISSMLGGGTPVNPILGDFETGNIVVKVEDVWGTYVDGTEGNYVDYQGAYYSSGTAP